MIQYILECIAFQLVFLIIYDFFLKRETFFQWNRAYLIGAYVLSMVLPWVKIEGLKTTVPQEYYVYPDFLWNRDDLAAAVTVTEESMFSISWEEGILYGGMFLATLYFGYKLHQIQKLRKNGSVRRFPNFTRVIVKNSTLAFSFFRSIFLGDRIVERDHESIIQHELVHIEQRHSWDLLFFEMMRIVGWFNPLVYVYQSRISELHEFIADSKVAKTHKKEQYEFLLSQVFQTENISFVNQFFKSSLIKKRIVMLQKTRSKSICQLKYLLLIPLILGMLFYTSSEAQEKNQIGHEQTEADAVLIEKARQKVEKEIKKLGSIKQVYMNHPNRSHIADSEGPILSKEVYFEYAILFRMSMEEMFRNRPPKLGSQGKDFYNRIPLPSTERYESYVSRKKAFQILDENLKFSIMSNKVNSGYDIEQIDKADNHLDDSFVLNVKDVRDLTGDEIRKFNNKMTEIFEKENSNYTNLVLADDQYRFQVFQAKPFVSINTLPGVSSDNKTEKDVAKYQEIKTAIPFAMVDEVPVFPGCENDENPRGCFQTAMQKHISKHFNYPKEAQEKGIQGRVAVMFTIAEDGSIKDIRKRGPDVLLENEVERIIKRLPKMKPGVHKGKNVSVPFSIPVTFKLQEEAEDEAMKISSRSGIDPLYIINGVETSKEDFEKLNPPDIESINILKGESAKAMYGDKGKNGVVQITTKKKN